MPITGTPGEGPLYPPLAPGASGLRKPSFALVDQLRSVDKQDETAKFTKEPSILEQKAYRDTWGVSKEDRERGVTELDRYLKWFYETVLLLRELLAENGSIYVHIGQDISHYEKAVLDEVFGRARYVNEIIWKRQSAKSGAFEGLKQYGRIHEAIFLYARSESWRWNQQFAPYEQDYLEVFETTVSAASWVSWKMIPAVTEVGTIFQDTHGSESVAGERLSPATG